MSVFIVGDAVMVGVNEMDGTDVTGTEGRKRKEVKVWRKL